MKIYEGGRQRRNADSDAFVQALGNTEINILMFIFLVCRHREESRRTKRSK